jgi:hypothetical protein
MCLCLCIFFLSLSQITKHLRTQRAAMIQTSDQYEFVYKCMVDHLDMSSGEVVYQNMPKRASKKAPPPPVRSTSAAPVAAPRTKNVVGLPAEGMEEDDMPP